MPCRWGSSEAAEAPAQRRSELLGVRDRRACSPKVILSDRGSSGAGPRSPQDFSSTPSLPSWIGGHSSRSAASDR